MDFVNITPQVEKAVADSGVKEGLCLVNRLDPGLFDLRHLEPGQFLSFLAFPDLLFQASGFLSPLEWKTWDLRMRAFVDPERASKDIVLVLVDQYSLDYYREQGISWPWPRQMYAALIDYFVRGGARACFLDIEMSEPSVYGVDDDRLLAESAARAGNVVFPVALSAEEKTGKADPASSLLLRFSISQPSRLAAEGFRSATLPLPELLCGPRRRKRDGPARRGRNLQADPCRFGSWKHRHPFRSRRDFRDRGRAGSRFHSFRSRPQHDHPLRPIDSRTSRMVSRASSWAFSQPSAIMLRT